jgi:uncharacterized membrane protein HdeD (DUF308 family)
MSTEKRKYVESHWVIFGLQGVIEMLAGLYLMFATREDVPMLMGVIGCTLLGLGLIEVFNMLHRKRKQRSWGMPLGVGVFEVALGVGILLTMTMNYQIHIALLASYAVLRSMMSILIGFRSFTNSTDKFLWVICGIVGAILGFIILADPGVSETTFVKLFGTFLMVVGLTDLVFSAHSRDQVRSAKAEKQALRAAGSKGKKAKK